MSRNSAAAGHRMGPIALFAGNDGPEPGEPDEQEVGSVRVDISRELGLAIAITCAQRGAAPADITDQVIARAIAEQLQIAGVRVRRRNTEMPVVRVRRIAHVLPAVLV